MSQIFALKVYVTQFDRKLQNSGRMAIDERQSDQNDVNMTSNRRCLVDVFLLFFFAISFSSNLRKSTTSLIHVKFCMPVYISKTQLRSRKSLIKLKPEDDLFDFLQIKKKKLARNKERSDLLHSNYTCFYFLCIYTENNCYIIQNACA